MHKSKRPHPEGEYAYSREVLLCEKQQPQSREVSSLDETVQTNSTSLLNTMHSRP